jgi:hypothetical protein
LGGVVSLEAWKAALADVLKGRPPPIIAPIVGVTPAAVCAWLRGESVPTATRWRALVLHAGLEDRWAELEAARDAVARKPTGRPRLPDDVYAAGVVARRRRKIQTQGAVSPDEV